MWLVDKRRRKREIVREREELKFALVGRVFRLRFFAETLDRGRYGEIWESILDDRSWLYPGTGTDDTNSET